MKVSTLAILGALALGVSATPVSQNEARAGSKSFMGSNLYFLPGMSDQGQDAYIADLANYGAKVVRVWVNQQSSGSCEKGSKLAVSVPQLETTIGKYNNQTLDAVDKVVSKLAKKGIKAIISPHDGNSLIGDYRKDIYYSKWGKDNFYTSQDAFDAYDKRIDYILNYKGATSGQVWKDWSDAIMAFDIQNEPMSADTSVCKNNDQKGWLCGRAKKFRSVLGAGNKIQIATGGVGGDISHDCNFIKAATSCAEIDLIAVHRYGGSESGNPNQWSNGAKQWVSESGGKLVFVEEWGVNTASTNPKTELPAQANDINKVGIPNLYWQFLPKATCSYDPAKDSGDQFGIYVEGDTDIAAVMKGASNANALQDWSKVMG
ncbi:glycoside hydrolase family 5 protein [Annulohypoxylon truncatum]|uniref:glycoside hydrolase family 5 protein n=1 Tax=Annulohypoxylon truncatum TaxID=327061 RepID=UPI002007F8D9|nr:glycoside hydrolase family 5 protein [Annulohypoxylon truncatum]KAI1213559.1 glycoside hydrolase family 5 protein [Annulohypoxylon truncatum]